MTKKEAKVIFTAIGIVLAVLLIVVFTKGAGKKGDNNNVTNTATEQNTEKYTTNLVDGTKINSGEEFNKVKKYKNIEISNIQFTYKDGRSVLLATMKNTGSTTHKDEIVKLTILDENNKVIDVLTPVISEMKPGGTRQLNVTVTGADSINAKDFKIEENK